VTTSVNPKQSTETARRRHSLRAVLMLRCQVLKIRHQKKRFPQSKRISWHLTP